MAEPYRTRLVEMLNELDLSKTAVATLETKHFFNGAALYANGTICLIHNPSGFAVKLRAEARDSLIAHGEGSEFRVFPNGPIKGAYVALSDAVLGNAALLRELINNSINYVLDLPAG